MRVGIAHDYFVQRGGAERVALAMASAFCVNNIGCLTYDDRRTFYLEGRTLSATKLRKLPYLRSRPELLLPLLPAMAEDIPVGDVDVLLCSSSGWAHGAQTNAPKVVYCHTPARWLYRTDEYFGSRSLRRSLAHPVLKRLRAWDKAAAAEASLYLANSRVVAERIEECYGIKPRIVPPPATLGTTPSAPISGIRPGFCLTVARDRGYKNLHVILEAARLLPKMRFVVVSDHRPQMEAGNVHMMFDLDEARLRWLYANCAVVVSMAHEDFGLTVIEGYQFGKPAVTLAAGGFLDTVIPGVTGEFVRSVDERQLASVLGDVDPSQYRAEDIVTVGNAYSLETFRAALLEAVEDVTA